MPSAQDWMQSILREVGAGLEGLPDEVLSAVLDKITPYLSTYWEMYASYALVFPRLQYLYTKRHCLNILLGQVRDLIQVSIGSAEISQTQLSDNLHKIYQNTNAEIQHLESLSVSSRGPAQGAINNPVVLDAWGRIYRTDWPGFYPNPSRPVPPWNR
jgi:hypothetical protein